MQELITFLSEYKYQIEYLVYAGLLIVTFIGLLKIGLFKRVFVRDIIYFLIILSYFGVDYLYKSDYTKTGYALIACLLIVLQIIKTIKYLERLEKIKIGALSHIKNADYDYFVTVDTADKMIDFSNSLAHKLGMGSSELSKQRFWDVFINQFDIVSLNDLVPTTENIETLKKEYFKKIMFNVSFQFRVQIKNIDEEVEYYQILIKPIYLHHQYLGKNIFINRNRWEIVSKLNSSLTKMMDLYEKSKQLGHMWLSMSSGVLLYFDYQSNTYVLTETFKRLLNTQKAEYTPSELLELIHSDDLPKYQSELENVNALEVTSIIYRMKINNKYRRIAEEAILMNPEKVYVSVIKTLPVRDENVDNVDYIKSLTTIPSTPNTRKVPKPVSSPGPRVKEIETSEDLKKLDEKMQKKDLDYLESLLNSAIKKRDK